MHYATSRDVAGLKISPPPKKLPYHRKNLSTLSKTKGHKSKANLLAARGLDPSRDSRSLTTMDHFKNSTPIEPEYLESAMNHEMSLKERLFRVKY